MARILALDYGKKRTGIAVTDPLQIIATALETVATDELIGYLKKYFASESVEKVVIGYPLNFDDSPTHATPLVDKFIAKFSHVFPQLPIVTWDERLTSKMAAQTIAQLGLSKKQRENKALLDSISATIILQEYLEAHPTSLS
ncbi:MAG TPA: Holliday junction resolvase RuvX [Flavipsychrobacter sp.]|nr:Holliday junction resolvase RuvX [Flavipsychrobacter sp.]